MIDWWALFQVYVLFATGTYTLLRVVEDRWWPTPRQHVLMMRKTRPVQVGRPA